MANDTETADQRQARLECMIEEFRVAQRQRRAKQDAAASRTAAQDALEQIAIAPGKIN
jgi:hypothetical protein